MRRVQQDCVLRRAFVGAAAALWLSGAAAVDGPPLVEQGRRIYVDGILPDGSPLKAVRFGGVSSTVGAEAACVTCHRRSGYGSIEGRILVPPVAGAVLFAPGVFSSRTGSTRGAHAVVSAAERFRTRSAYDEISLRRALHDGIDPDGVRLQPPMARYRLDARSVKALAAYLRYLSDSAIPGMDGGTLHLGTVITPDVPPAQRDALLEVLQAYAASRKNWDMRWQLHVWQLQGGPEEWGAQLDAYYREQPVFALLSGAGSVRWEPVHRFCERRAVACILPSVESPSGSEQDRYSLYFSPGLGLEGRLLAQHLRAEPAPPRRLIQVVADAAGQFAADATRQALAGSPIAVEQMGPGEYADRAASPDGLEAVVWWLRPAEIAKLGDAWRRSAPSALYLSAELAPPETLVRPEGWEESVRYVSVFDPLAPRRAQTTLVPWLARQGLPLSDLRVRADAFAACSFFSNAVSALQVEAAHGVRGPLTRERLLEMLESSLTLYRDDNAPYYWQLSLGPAQRMLVKGGMLLRYAGAEGEGWVPATSRVVP